MPAGRLDVPRQNDQPFINGVQRDGSVNTGFASAEQVQIWSMDDLYSYRVPVVLTFVLGIRNILARWRDLPSRHLRTAAGTLQHSA
jgi:hypothetical protein